MNKCNLERLVEIVAVFRNGKFRLITQPTRKQHREAAYRFCYDTDMLSKTEAKEALLMDLRLNLDAEILYHENRLAELNAAIIGLDGHSPRARSKQHV